MEKSEICPHLSCGYISRHGHGHDDHNDADDYIGCADNRHQTELLRKAIKMMITVKIAMIML